MPLNIALSLPFRLLSKPAPIVNKDAETPWLIISPDVGWMTPDNIFNKEDFPEPFFPMIPMVYYLFPKNNITLSLRTLPSQQLKINVR